MQEQEYVTLAIQGYRKEIHACTQLEWVMQTCIHGGSGSETKEDLKVPLAVYTVSFK